MRCQPPQTKKPKAIQEIAWRQKPRAVWPTFWLFTTTIGSVMRENIVESAVSARRSEEWANTSRSSTSISSSS